MSNQAYSLRTVALKYDEADDLASMRSAYDLGADGVSMDLEDHVPRRKLPAARSNIRTILEEMGGITPTFVRVNEITSRELLDDLEAVVCDSLHAVQIPKCGGPQDVVVLDGLLALFEERAGIEPGSILISPFLENARSTHESYEIATASPRVAYMGGWATRNGDPAISIGYHWTPEMTETLYLRQKVLLDVRAAGVPNPLGGLWNPFDDLEGLERFAHQTLRIGYDGMAVLPFRDHVTIVNQVFTPSQEDVDYWAEAIPLIDDAETDVVFRGEELPPNKAKWGRKVLAQAASFGVVPTIGQQSGEKFVSDSEGG